MTISDTLKMIYASAPPDGAPGSRYVETLSLHHPGFSRDHYITNDQQPWDFQLEDGTPQTFAYVPFLVTMPRSDGQGRQDLNVTIGNIGRVIMEELELAVEQPYAPLECVYRVYLNIPDSQPQNDPVLSLTIVTIAANVSTITATAGRADILNRPFPTDVYRIDTFPGLDR